jgi:hypothetical protein
LSDSWQHVPRLRPHKCHRLNSGAEEHGPYFEESFDYIDPRDPNVGAYGEGQALRLYHSAAWLREICEKPGSPFVLLSPDEFERLRNEAYDRSDVDAAELRIEELEAEVASLREQSGGLDEGKLIDLLDRRYAKKPGRKPAGTAA